MTIFALDSAGKTAGVALWQDEALLYESYLSTGNTHSETLLALCKAAFCATKLSPADITVFAANAGPGSFTGLRIGLGMVKGFAFPFDTLCAPVSTLEALAQCTVADGVIGTALDARRGEVYCAAFKRTNGVLERLSQDGTLSAAAFAAQLAQLGTNAVCMGDGAHLVCGQAPCLTLLPASVRFGRAHGICLAAQRLYEENSCISAAELTPEYHRLSQAERERAQRERTSIL